MDALDRLIRRCAEGLHEAARQRATARRHRKDREAEARVQLAEIEDRIRFHFPPTKRESRPDLSDGEFLQLREAEARHRVKLMMTLAAEMAVGDDEMPEHPLNF